MRFRLIAKWTMNVDDHIESAAHGIELEQANQVAEQVYTWLTDTSKHGSVPKIEIEEIK